MSTPHPRRTLSKRLVANAAEALRHVPGARVAVDALRPDRVTFQGYRLPRPGLRRNGPAFRDDRYYLSTSVAEARRVTDDLGCRTDSRLLDLGCGHGRLPIALAPLFPDLDYRGLDVSARCIQWCRTHIQARYPAYRFDTLDVVNARYNPSGAPLTERFHFPLEDGAVDIVYMWGVFTNMEPEHLPPYAAEIARVLRPGGRLFLTANLERGVPKVSLNPEASVPWPYSGPLHIVRYEFDYFVETFEGEGISLAVNRYHAAGDCQSELYFVRG